MNNKRLIIGIAFGLVLCLPSCLRDDGSLGKVKVIRGTPVGSSQKALAIDAINKVREEWNSGNCHSIYDQADRSFHRSQTPDEWWSQCTFLRKRLGAWRSFTFFSAERDVLQSPVVYLDGSAVFASGRTELWLGWRLENQRARLVCFNVKDDHNHWLQMPQPIGGMETDPPVPTPGRVRAA